MEVNENWREINRAIVFVVKECDYKKTFLEENAV
jgi:hypothetical protein